MPGGEVGLAGVFQINFVQHGLIGFGHVRNDGRQASGKFCGVFVCVACGFGRLRETGRGCGQGCGRVGCQGLETVLLSASISVEIGNLVARDGKYPRRRVRGMT